MGGGGRSKSSNFNPKGPLIGAPDPPKINHGYGPGVRERLQLAISIAAIFKEGVIEVENSAVNGDWNGSFFVCLFFGRFVFCFALFFFLICLFVFNHLERALNWYQK